MAFKTARQQAFAAAKASGNFSAFRGGGAVIRLAGMKEVSNVLRELSDEHGRGVAAKLGRDALRAGLKEETTAIKQAAPVYSLNRMVGKRKKKHAKLRRLKKAIGSRMMVNKKRGEYEAKAGLNVGKAFGKFPAAGIFATGTQRRETKAGKNRGRMPENRFVIRATEGAESRVQTTMLRKIEQRLPIEVDRMRAKHNAGKR